MFELKTLQNYKEIRVFLTEQAVPFTQDEVYFNWKKDKEIKRFYITKDGETVAYFQAIKFPLIFGKNYYYIPHGPVIKNESEQLLGFIKKSLSELKDKKTVFIRLDFFPLMKMTESVNWLKRNYFKVPVDLSSGSNFQPRHDWFLNLKTTAEEILKAMHQKARYSIRLAEKKGVQVKIINKDFGQYLPDFYNLMLITAKRNGFSLHPKEYYENIFADLDRNNSAGSFLSLAYYNDELLAGDLIIVSNGIANYVFGGSSNNHRNLAPTYLAQWRAVLQAKELGCSDYNFGAVTLGPEGNLSSLTDYKSRFGGYLVKYSDFYDYVLSWPWYIIYLIRRIIK